MIVALLEAASTAFKLLKHPITWLALLAALLALQTMRLNHARADLTTARAALINPATKHTWQDDYTASQVDLGTCRTNNTTLSDALKTQNAAVLAAKAEGDRRTALATQAAANARAVAESRRQEALAIMARVSGPDVCRDALALAREP